MESVVGLGLNLLGKSVAFVDGTEPSARPDLIALVTELGAQYRERFAIGAIWLDRALLAALVYDNIRG